MGQNAAEEVPSHKYSSPVQQFAQWGSRACASLELQDCKPRRWHAGLELAAGSFRSFESILLDLGLLIRCIVLVQFSSNMPSLLFALITTPGASFEHRRRRLLIRPWLFQDPWPMR